MTKDIYLPRTARIVKSRMLNATEIYLRVAMEEGELDYKPGQFVEVSLAGYGEAPITITSAPVGQGYFELVVRRVGNVTKRIHALRAGDKIGIRGPFGKGHYPVDEMKGSNLVFICGGIGLVPQRSFINYVLANRGDYGDLTVLLGTKCPSQRFLQSELEMWAHKGDMLFLETVDEAEESWEGNVGVVTTLMSRIEEELVTGNIFICGPPIMYKFVMLQLIEAAVPKERIFLNLERRMKCGVGKCGHCQINSRYVCIDGPVFCYADLKGMPEAI